ncbi:hypothetical protein [Helicobacter suis]|uniref:hypothetical protein n=1 Tax=Helicobacter suis TaxID=104628 RepID=UPI0013D55BA4|nr:hypothetical protein [Helicobacter suis]
MQVVHDKECHEALTFFSKRYFGDRAIWMRWPNIVAFDKEEAQHAYYGASVLCAIAEHYEQQKPLRAVVRNIATHCEHLRAAISFRKPFVQKIDIDVMAKIAQFKAWQRAYEANKAFYNRLAKKTKITYHILPLERQPMDLLNFLSKFFKKQPPKNVLYQSKDGVYSSTYYALTDDGLIICKETKKVIGALESIIY